MKGHQSARGRAGASQVGAAKLDGGDAAFRGIKQDGNGTARATVNPLSLPLSFSPIICFFVADKVRNKKGEGGITVASSTLFSCHDLRL